MIRWNKQTAFFGVGSMLVAGLAIISTDWFAIWVLEARGGQYVSESLPNLDYSTVTAKLSEETGFSFLEQFRGRIDNIEVQDTVLDAEVIELIDASQAAGISLANCDVTAKRVQLQNCESLEVLDSVWSVQSQFVAGNKLKYLGFERCDLSGLDFEFHGNLPMQIRTLRLIECMLSDKLASKIVGTASPVSLELDCTDCSLLSLRGRLSRVESLSLSNRSVSREEFQVISGSRVSALSVSEANVFGALGFLASSSLTVLDASNSNASESDFVGCFRSCPNLQIIYADGCSLGPSFLESLTQLEELISVNVSGSGLSRTACQAFSAERPDVELVW